MEIREELVGSSRSSAPEGTAGIGWENVGWKVRVGSSSSGTTGSTEEPHGQTGFAVAHEVLPFAAKGDGLQSVYLAEVPKPFAEVLAGLIGSGLAPASCNGRLASRWPGGNPPHPTGDDLDSPACAILPPDTLGTAIDRLP